MMKLSKEDTKKMCLRLRQLKDVPVGRINQIINKEFNVNYDRSSIKYWYSKVFKDSWLKKLELQEKQMQKWQEELNATNQKNFTESLAEDLFDLFEGNIDQQEFKHKLLVS